MPKEIRHGFHHVKHTMSKRFPEVLTINLIGHSCDSQVFPFQAVWPPLLLLVSCARVADGVTEQVSAGSVLSVLGWRWLES